MGKSESMTVWLTFNFELDTEDDAEEFERRIQGDVAVFSPDDEPFRVDRWKEYVYVQAAAESRSSRELSPVELIERYACDVSRAAIVQMNSVTESGRAFIVDCENGVNPILHLRGEEHLALLDVHYRIIYEEKLDFRLRATAEGDPGEDRFILGIRRPDSSNIIDLSMDELFRVENADVKELDLEWEL